MTIKVNFKTKCELIGYGEITTDQRHALMLVVLGTFSAYEFAELLIDNGFEPFLSGINECAEKIKEGR